MRVRMHDNHWTDQLHRAQHPHALLSKNEYDDGNPIQNNNPGGGARGPSDETGGPSAPRSRRCARMRAISAGPPMLAITSSRPPQRAHH